MTDYYMTQPAELPETLPAGTKGRLPWNGVVYWSLDELRLERGRYIGKFEHACGFVSDDRSSTNAESIDWATVPRPSPIPTGGPFKVKVGDRVSVREGVWCEGHLRDRPWVVSRVERYKGVERCWLGDATQPSRFWMATDDVSPSPPPAPTGEAQELPAPKTESGASAGVVPNQKPSGHLNSCVYCMASIASGLQACAYCSTRCAASDIVTLNRTAKNDAAYRKHIPAVLRSMGDVGIDRPCESKYPKLAQSVSACGFGWRVR